MLDLAADELWLAHELLPQRALGRFRASQRNMQTDDDAYLSVSVSLRGSCATAPPVAPGRSADDRTGRHGLHRRNRTPMQSLAPRGWSDGAGRALDLA
jgi:hypothetical protein